MLCVRNIPRAKKFMDQRRAGEYQAFPSKIFCLTVPKDVIGRGGGSIKVFRRKIFDSQTRKTSYKNPSVFDYFRVSKRFML